MMYDQLVLSGGSVRGVAHVGVVQYLEEHDILPGIKHYFGTSFGAIICFLLVLGFTATEMRALMLRFLSDQSKSPYDVEKLLNITDTFGFEDGADLCGYLEDALEQKLKVRTITFIDLAKLTGNNLVISGTNLTKQQVEYFCVDTHPNMDVVLAVRISVSLPLIFTPVMHDGDVYVDGGLLDHFPYEYCCKHCTLNSMLGVVIDVPKVDIPQVELTLPTYVNAIFECMFQNLNPPPTKFAENIVRVKCVKDDGGENLGFDWSTFRFQANAQMIQNMSELGYAAVNDFFIKSQIQCSSRCTFPTS